MKSGLKSTRATKMFPSRVKWLTGAIAQALFVLNFVFMGIINHQIQ